MDVPRSEPTGARFDELHAEATEALAYAANSLRAIRDRYRGTYLDDLSRWQFLSDDLGMLERDGESGKQRPGRLKQFGHRTLSGHIHGFDMRKDQQYSMWVGRVAVNGRSYT